jgi:glycosyltransferase involved in cell wall biosynthesis
MNICYIHTADFTQHKGSSIHVKELVNRLSRYHNIVMIVDKWDGTPIDLVNISELNCPRPLNMVWRTLCTCLALLRLLIHENIDLLYAKSPLEGAIAGSISTIFKIPCIYEVNGFIGEEYEIIKANPLRKYVSSFLETLALKKATHLICVTPWIKDILQERGLKKGMDVVPNGADIRLFHPIEDARKALSLDKDTFLIGYMGTLKAWQGMEYLLAAIPYVLQEEQVKVLIVGGGELKQWLLSTISRIGLQEHIIVHDEVDHTEVPFYISACDVCVLLKKPLSSGYSPLKLYEYMACQRPVVASRLHGFECLENEGAGILVNPEDPGEVARAILTLLRDEPLREIMGKNGRSFVEKYHTWEKTTHDISTICNKVGSH